MTVTLIGRSVLRNRAVGDDGRSQLFARSVGEVEQEGGDGGSSIGKILENL